MNYQHLYYFWTVAREGTVVAAAERLRLAQPTISAQLKTFEEALGHKLFERSGRNLQLTETGKLTFSYADEIFSLGTELQNALQEQQGNKPLRLHVGVADMLPKLIVSSLLSPALETKEKVKLIVYDGKPNELLAKLSIHGLDLVLTDAPINPEVKIKAFNHLLGKSTIAFYGSASLTKKFGSNLEETLQEAPLLLPTPTTTLRRTLDQWFDRNSITPNIVGEYEDTALLKLFGQKGVGFFPLPVAIEDDVVKQYGVKRLGILPNAEEHFYAISRERKIKHPGVQAITSAARNELFTE